MKCRVCRGQLAQWAMQYIPGECEAVFNALGDHFKNYYVLEICNDCRQRYTGGEVLEWIRGGKRKRYQRIPDIEGIEDYAEEGVAEG